MKNKLNYLCLLLIFVVAFLCVSKVNADETASFYIRGTNINKNGQAYTVEKSPGDSVTFTFGVQTDKCIVSSRNGLSWSLTNIGVPTATNTFSNFIYKSGSIPTDTIEFASIEPVCNSSGVDLATFTFTVPENYTGNPVITIRFEDSAVSIEDEGGGNRRGLDVTGATLTINYKAPSGGEGGPSTGTLDVDTENVTITLETNGGIGLSPITVEKGSKLSSISIPTKSGYLFDGWYTDKDLKNVFDITKAVNSDMTLYAKWTKTSSSAAVEEPVTTDDGDAIDIGYGILIDKNEGQDADAANITPKKNGEPTVTDTTATIKFDAGIDKWTCYVYRSSKADSGFELITKEPIECSKNTSYTDKNLKPDTAYFYRVRLLASKNVSDAISVKTLVSSSGSDAEEKEAKKKGNVGPGKTGAITPAVITIALTGAFIGIKKYYNDNTFFNKI